MSGRRLGYVVLTAACLLSSCSGRTKKSVSFFGSPALSPKQMVCLLVDAHLSEAHIKHRNSSDVPRDEVLKKYQISEQSYQQTYRHYALQATLMHNIYLQVVDSLTRLQRLSTPTVPDVIVSDSLKDDTQL